jgi:MFS superfamily sulfate permease-like transporter
MGLPEKIYTDRDLERAETKGRVIGWLQGGIVVLVGGMILNVVGWIPTLAIVGVVGYVAYKMLSKRSGES